MSDKKGLVIWCTGLPCSGKTTLSKEIEKYFRSKGLPIQRLDGDVVRTTISEDLGFSKEDRDRHTKRMVYVAQMLANNGVNVVAAFISPYQAMRDFAREQCENFVEVYVKCSLEMCEKRDVKGMYAQARRGERVDFTGVDDVYEEPQDPDIVVDTEHDMIERSLEKVIDHIVKKL